MYRLRSSLLAFGVALVALSPMALAQPDDADVERARALFGEGVELVDQARWAEAEARFREALALRPSPVIAYNLASTLEAQGAYVEASTLLHGVLGEPDLPQALRVASADKLASILPRIAHLTIVLSGASAEASVSLDGRSLTLAEQRADLPVDPGRHQVVARAGMREASAQVEASEGESVTVELVLPVPSPEELAAGATNGAPTANAEDVRARRKKWLWPVVVGVAVVAAVIATSVAVTRDRSEAPIMGTFPPGVVTVQVDP